LDDRTIARLVSAAGTTLAKQLLLAGDKVSAKRAFELGYLLEVTSPVGLPASAAQLASRIAKNVLPVVVACKQSINLSASLPSDGSSIPDTAIVASYLSEEFRARVLPLDVES
jgi:enoyl-CoA hydratase/carnithine racemase